MTLPLRIDKEGNYLCPKCNGQLDMVMGMEYRANAIAAPGDNPDDNDFDDIVYDEDYWGARGVECQEVYCTACNWSAKYREDIFAAVAGKGEL